MIVDPIGAREEGADWMCWCLDYSRSEVRAHILRLFEELANLYPIDGFQLDWLRFPRHLPGDPAEVWALREHLSSVVREAHRIFSARGVKLAVRVPTSIAGCRHLGLDIGEWARNGWIDMVTACPFLTTDFTMPLDAMREAMQPANIPLYAGFDFGHGWQIHSPESLRAAATSLYACGADGIYVFNHPCWNEHTVLRSATPLEGLGQPETACRKPLLFSIPIRHHIRKEVIDGPGVLPVETQPGTAAQLELFLPPDALPARRAMVHVIGPGDFSLEVNGTQAEELPTRRKRDLFPWYTCGGIGNNEFSYEAEDCRVYRVPPDALNKGINSFVIRNGGKGTATIRRLNLALM